MSKVDKSIERTRVLYPLRGRGPRSPREIVDTGKSFEEAIFEISSYLIRAHKMKFGPARALAYMAAHIIVSAEDIYLEEEVL